MKAPIVTALLASLASGRAIYSPRDLRVARHEGNLVTSTLAADPTAITEPAGPNDSFDANSNGDAHNNQAPTGQQSCNAQLDQCTEQVDTAANNVSVEQCQQQQGSLSPELRKDFKVSPFLGLTATLLSQN